MRIIGGEFRGRKLFSPPNEEIRPTTDRMRETIFNILSHSTRGFQNANVLDVFAGTGALGLESLSRGAHHATFFDKNAKSLQLVKKNIALLKLEDKTTLKSVTAPLFPPTKMTYDFIFIDPPYNLNVYSESMSKLENMGYIAQDCVIIIECLTSITIEINNKYSLINKKTFGNSCVFIYKY
ncbi:MAG: 16S rRNA (guanine(966)-N(2))-methyltransferase RsmD [Emcibacter sp.]|nr:16S rRNA (guanine(966)-N(2))-methyltransferase RsmD [Emcibacter sp.]